MLSNRSPFLPFAPTSAELHYKDQLVYKEMLSILAQLETEKLQAELKDAIKFSSQIDGSVDFMQHDNKFVFIRFNSPAEPIEVKTRFVKSGSHISQTVGDHRRLEPCDACDMRTSTFFYAS